jgi:Na+/H+ antiporter NhaD/arsenite permease-like protein
MLAGIHDERSLAFFMSGISALLSTFLTNDITLFIVVPLTLSMQKALKNDLIKVVIFEAIAVNTGSTLTPIGNPQNIFIWHSWGISFTGYMLKMAVPVAVMCAALALFIFICFPSRKLSYNAHAEAVVIRAPLGTGSLIIMAAFIAALQTPYYYAMLPVIIVFMAVTGRQALMKTDWLLILTFILMFIDFSLISRSGAVINAVGLANLDSGRGVFTMSALVSQFISNVPAAIFMSKFTGNWEAIAYGVNIAGNGTVIGSLANIIALRLARPAGASVWLDFHRYSVPFFLVTGGAVWLILR